MAIKIKHFKTVISNIPLINRFPKPLSINRVLMDTLTQTSIKIINFYRQICHLAMKIVKL